VGCGWHTGGDRAGRPSGGLQSGVRGTWVCPGAGAMQRYGELLAVAGGRERLLHDMQGRDDAPARPRERRTLAARCTAARTRSMRASSPPARCRCAPECASCSRIARVPACSSASSPPPAARMSTRCSRCIWAGIGPRDSPWWYRPMRRPAKSPIRRPTSWPSRPWVQPHQAVALEDAPAGVAATRAAGVPVIVTRSHYFPASAAEGALAVGPSLGQTEGWEPAASSRAGRIDLSQIALWHALAASSAAQWDSQRGLQ
jgi:hypothetical protein